MLIPTYLPNQPTYLPTYSPTLIHEVNFFNASSATLEL